MAQIFFLGKHNFGGAIDQFGRGKEGGNREIDGAVLLLGHSLRHQHQELLGRLKAKNQPGEGLLSGRSDSYQQRSAKSGQADAIKNPNQSGEIGQEGLCRHNQKLHRVHKREPRYLRQHSFPNRRYQSHHCHFFPN
jgi:hypothetical protein